MRLPSPAAVALAAVAATTATVRAQSLHFSVEGGVSLAGPESQRGVIVGDVFRLTGGADNGFFAALAVERPFHGSPLAARVEAFFNQLTTASPTFDTATGIQAYQADRDQVWGAALSLVVSPPEGRLVPYALAGVGWMHTRLRGSWLSADVLFPVDQSAEGLGLLAGAGLRLHLGRTTYFVESRYGQGLGSQHGSPFLAIAIGVRW